MSKEEKPRIGRPISHTPDQLLERLIGAADEILHEQGADADFSMAQLAQRARISKRTVYTVIDSKEELIAQIIRRGAKAATAILERPVASADEAREVLSRFLKEWAAFACGRQAVGIYVMAIRERTRYPAIGEAYYRARNDHVLQQLAAWLKRMDGKKFFEVPDPVMTSDFVLSMSSAERQRMLALGVEAPVEDGQLELRIASIVEFVVCRHGACAAPLKARRAQRAR